MTKVVIKKVVTDNSKPFLVDFIASHCDVSKSQIKKALIYGGGWLQKRGARKLARCRKAKQVLNVNDRVEFYFDSTLLEAVEPVPVCLLSSKEWAIWYKPANVVSQGSQYGDAHSMENLVGKLSGHPNVFLVHRLDREASGVLIVAYTKAAAAELSAVWQSRNVTKCYEAEVLGVPDVSSGIINFPLDGKAAESHYRIICKRPNTAVLEMNITTGRFHQIRRHLDMLGHPIIGDPRYGEGNKNTSGMRLTAVKVEFEFREETISYELPQSLRLV